jgi:hypothetical protein
MWVAWMSERCIGAEEFAAQIARCAMLNADRNQLVYVFVEQIMQVRVYPVGFSLEGSYELE